MRYANHTTTKTKTVVRADVEVSMLKARSSSISLLRGDGDTSFYEQVAHCLSKNVRRPDHCYACRAYKKFSTAMRVEAQGGRQSTTLLNFRPGVKLYAPAALSASNFAAAVPFPPETMAPTIINRGT